MNNQEYERKMLSHGKWIQLKHFYTDYFRESMISISALCLDRETD